MQVVILYVIHDFYEGVKQQGTLNSNGLLNDEDMQPLRGQAFTQVNNRFAFNLIVW